MGLKLSAPPLHESKKDLVRGHGPRRPPRGKLAMIRKRVYREGGCRLLQEPEGDDLFPSVPDSLLRLKQPRFRTSSHVGLGLLASALRMGFGLGLLASALPHWPRPSRVGVGLGVLLARKKKRGGN